MLSPYFQLLVTFQNNSPQASSFASLVPAPGEAGGIVVASAAFLKDTQRLSGGHGGRAEAQLSCEMSAWLSFPSFSFFLLLARLIFFFL